MRRNFHNNKLSPSKKYLGIFRLPTSNLELPTSAGFTLVELMVSLSLFVIVVLAAISSLYTVNASARRVEAMRSVLDNLNFAMENMSRTIRTSSGIACFPSTDCTFSGSSPDFPDTAGTRLNMFDVRSTGAVYTGYRFATVNGKGVVQKCVDVNGDNSCAESEWVGITAPEINVQNLSFYIDGEIITDNRQPSVIIMIQGEAVTQRDVAPFAVQTYVSVRTAE